MSVDTSQSQFSFSEIFDSLFLKDLYGDDLVTAAEVFSGSVVRIAEELPSARSHLETGDRERLCRVIHRIKPLFGYAGLTSIQEAVEGFEERCRTEDDMAVLSEHYRVLERVMLEASERMASEHSRLLKHINRNA